VFAESQVIGSPMGFLQGGGAIGAAVREFDWTRTPLGAPSSWPQSLRTLVGVMLACRQPMFMAWGPEKTWLYNDAFVPILGRKHPGALGRPALQVWAEARDTLAPMFDRVFAGEAVGLHDISLMLDRHGRLEESHFAFSYTPAREESGTIAGLFGACIETTERVLAERRQEGEIARQRRLFEQAPGFITILNGPQHTYEFANDAYLKLAGHRPLLGRTVREAFPELATQGFFELLDQVYATGERYVAFHVPIRLTLSGSSEPHERFLDFIYEPTRNEAGQITGIFVEGHDVTDEHLAQQELQNRERLQSLLNGLNDRFRDLEEEGDLSYAVGEFLGKALNVDRAGYGTVDPIAKTISIVRDWNAPGIASLAGVLNFLDYGSYIEDLMRGDTVVFEDAAQDPRTASTAARLAAINARAAVNMPVIEQGVLVALLYLNHGTPREWTTADVLLMRDVAERTRAVIQRRRAEQELRALAESLEFQVAERTAELGRAHEALRQAQKMEAVGQLTGGLAHDFNNLLAGISGSLEVIDVLLAQGRLANIARYIKMAQGSTRRAAALTQRLLAFSRRQTLDPRPIDANRLVGGMEDLIRRTAGPLIEVEVVGAGGLWLTRADPSQLENALLNLCLNARDAMAPGGGRLTIETANKWLDERAATERELPPGQYISLCVSDTGTGMSPEVAARAFDPFFTTKPIGLGTGLGLSMVYGFARQSGGQVRIYSELGKGTTMCLYLPRYLGNQEFSVAPPDDAVGESGAGETVLVIDDEPTVRLLVTDLLQEHGYKPLEAEDGPAGLRILESNARIDLLITDVGLPGGMNGRQVADAARVSRPDLKVLFITGYAENAAVGNGHLDPGMEILTKPFAMASLANKIREMITG
jgi:signal transduction histidine kinase/PAS domain-containing protein